MPGASPLVTKVLHHQAAFERSVIFFNKSKNSMIRLLFGCEVLSFLSNFLHFVDKFRGDVSRRRRLAPSATTRVVARQTQRCIFFINEALYYIFLEVSVVRLEAPGRGDPTSRIVYLS